MKKIDQRIAQAMLAAPDAAWTMATLRGAVGCTAAELKEAVQRMRWAGRIRMDALQLAESMRPAPAPKVAPKKRRKSATPGRGPGQASAEAGTPYPAAEGAGAATTDVPAPEARETGSAARLPAAGAGAPPRNAPAQPIESVERTCSTVRGREKGALAPEAGSAPPPPPPAPPIQAAPRPKAAASWIEKHLARRDAARAFLAGKGRHPYPTGGAGELRWQVPGWSGRWTDHELIVIAQEYGFEKEAANG